VVSIIRKNCFSGLSPKQSVFRKVSVETNVNPSSVNESDFQTDANFSHVTDFWNNLENDNSNCLSFLKQSMYPPD